MMVMTVVMLMMMMAVVMVVVVMMMLMMVMMRMVMMMNNMDGQGCGKCLFCLKISALCECTEEDKVEDIFLFQFFLAPTHRESRA